MKSLKQSLDAIKKANNIVIISHVGPDGDTLGSMLALKEIILKNNPNKLISTIVAGNVPEVYQFLPGIEETVCSDDPSLLGSYDLAITVDCAALDRTGNSIGIFRQAKNRLNIDHHVTNDGFGDINLIDGSAAATGEIIYHIAQKLEVEMTKEIAINIYTAILTDTGGFRFANTSPETFIIASKLMNAGVSPGDIYKKCYESKPIQMVKINAYAVNNAIFCEDDKIAYTLVKREDLNNYNANDDHLDGISEALRQIDSVEVSMILKETLKGYTKVSFRSNRPDVCRIAEFFGGGGHKLAAGCTIEKNLNEALNEVLPIVKKQIKK